MNQIQQESPFWYALQVRTKLTRVASLMLSGKGYETFLPTYSSCRTWSDRVKQLELPLFPGYLFCRFDVNDRLLPILTTPGVLSIVGAGKVPTAIPDSEIHAIQAVVQSGLPARPWPQLTVGSRVLIEKGPLAGIEGVALMVDKEYRIILSVPLLQRSVAVEIEREWARPIMAARAPRGVSLEVRGPRCNVA
jgi:transcription antitermination factor NusG